METTTPTGPDRDHPSRVRVETLKVLHDYLVIEPLAPPSKTGALFIPDAASERERSHRGVVLVVGPGDWNEAGTALVPMTVEEGDLVFFGKYAGTLESFDGREVLVMRERELRLRIAENGYQVVRHPEAPKASHLIEDHCDICHGVPMEAPPAASVDMQRLRELALPAGAAEIHAMQAAAGGGPAMVELRDDQAAAEGEDLVEDLNRHLAAAGFSGARMIALEGKRRPCPVQGCGLLQRLAQTTEGLLWVGAICGHVDEGARGPASSADL
jgi:chaperonin GroES